MNSSTCGIISIIFLIILAAQSAHSSTCPDTIFEGCDCMSFRASNGQQYMITCETTGTAKPNYFPKRLNPVNQYNVLTLTFRNYAVESIPADSFNNLDIGSLILDKIKVDNIKVSSFRGIKSMRSLISYGVDFKTFEKNAYAGFKNTLTSLSISGVSLTQMNTLFGEFGALPNLNSISISNSNLNGQFNPDWLNGYNGLDTIDINGNNLESFGNKVFQDFPKLGFLYVSGNKFGSIKPILNAFSKNLARVYLLNVAGNQIDALSVDDLTPIANVRLLVLENNKLKTLPKGFAAKLSNVESLSLNGNLFSNINDLMELATMKPYYLRIERNLFTRVPDISKFTNILGIYMSNQNGQLTKIDDYAFNRALPIDNVDLSQNDIQSYGNKAFCSSTPNSPLSYILISYNSFKRMDKCYFNQLSQRAGQKEVVIEVIPDYDGQNVNDVCSCELIGYGKSKLVRVKNICSDFFNSGACSNYNPATTDAACQKKTALMC